MQSNCPHCGYKVTEAYCPQDPKQRPKDGDMTMCINCGKFSAFKDGSLRKLDTKEKMMLSLDQNAFMMWLAWTNIKEEREKKAKLECSGG